MGDYLNLLRTTLHDIRADTRFEGLYEAATYTRTGADTYDPATGDVTPGSGTVTSLRVRIESFDTDEIDDDHILHTDRLISIEHLDLPSPPLVADTIAVRDKTFLVHRVLEPATSVTWLVHGRAA